MRDHYLARLFGLDPVNLRYAEHERYLTLSRVVSGEVMAAVFAEWRRERSSCRGGLIWFWRDLWCGAGWGVVDALGAPKAAFYYLRRVLQPVSVAMSDEGGNGLFVHIVNERADSLGASLTRARLRSASPAARSRSPPARPWSSPLPSCSTTSATFPTPIGSARRRRIWSWRRCTARMAGS